MGDNMKEKNMLKVIKLAKKAELKGDVPVGAIIVSDNKIIGSGYNQKEYKKNPIKHAEIIAIEKACKTKNDWRLDGCLLFVNLEPCIMCMGAIIESRIKKIICGTKNPKYTKQIKSICKGHGIDIEYCENSETYSKILKNFFIKKRIK